MESLSPTTTYDCPLPQKFRINSWRLADKSSSNPHTFSHLSLLAHLWDCGWAQAQPSMRPAALIPAIKQVRLHVSSFVVTFAARAGWWVQKRTHPTSYIISLLAMCPVIGVHYSYLIVFSMYSYLIAHACQDCVREMDLNA